MFGRLSKYLKHRPILRRWILVGLAIVLLTGVGMIGSAFFLVHKLYAKEESLQEELLREQVASIENICEEVVLGAQTFITNNLVQIAAKKHDENLEDKMRLSEIADLMDEYGAVHDVFGKMYLFLPKNTPSVLTKEEFINISDNINSVQGLGLTAEDMQILYNDALYSKFKVAGSGSEKRLFYSMSTQYAAPFEEQDAVLLIEIDKTKMKEAINNNYNFLLISEDDEYIELGNGGLDEEMITECKASVDKHIVGKKVIYPFALGPYGLRMVAVLDTGLAIDAVKPFVVGVIIYGLALILLGGIFVTHIMRVQYRPIESLLDFMDKYETTRFADGSELNDDEFKRIEIGISKSINSIQMLQVSQKELDKFKNDNETRIIRLLNYGTDTLSEDDGDGNRYLVVSYDIDNPTETPMDQKERDQVWFIIHNVSEELIGKENLLITGGLAHWFYNIVELRGQDELSLPDLTDKLNTVCSFIREKFDIALVANISDIHHGKKGIPTANREAMLVREYRIYVGTLPNVAFYKELSLDDEAKATLTSWDQMEQVQNLYRMHRGIEAQSMLDNIVNAAVESSKGTDSVDESEKENSGKSMQLVEKAKEFVDKQYSDKDMNVNSVANELNVNNSYLSRTFKQIYGIGMLEYINNVRLDNAEILMANGMTVKDAADKVGFTTPRPLIRCFREKHGTTPGDFYKSK
ncbi:helix-turn-helix domain-containing protein [Butyrivibrio sp. MB2005]|uniref:helix-turn-helix domain-containing protein n=2 Tax=unclassified Butyrivibrio TaxID=2639466 RepID=UPI00041BC288|nr:helix-turn-helix domain-containing protein [Butyrivibrio sp. MB2005]